MKELYTLQEDEFVELVEASKPVPYLIAGGMSPPSQYDNAMRVWGKVAARVGCKLQTIAPGTSDRTFYAEPLS